MILTVAFDNKFDQIDEADYMFIFQIKHQYSFWIIVHILQGRIQDFKLGGGRKYLGYFVWKITILRQQILFFSNVRGGGGGRRMPPPGSAPVLFNALLRVLT